MSNSGNSGGPRRKGWFFKLLILGVLVWVFIKFKSQIMGFFKKSIQPKLSGLVKPVEKVETPAELKND